jgi:hypothetical protein
MNETQTDSDGRRWLCPNIGSSGSGLRRRIDLRRGLRPRDRFSLTGRAAGRAIPPVQILRHVQPTGPVTANVARAFQAFRNVTVGPHELRSLQAKGQKSTSPRPQGRCHKLLNRNAGAFQPYDLKRPPGSVVAPRFCRVDEKKAGPVGSRPEDNTLVLDQK